jgi:hypothetical protein
MPHEVAPDTPHRSTESPDPVATTFVGRVFLGTVLAMGLYLALHHVATGLFLALDPESPGWSLSFQGLALVHAAQVVAVVFGCLVAAASRVSGYSIGVIVGTLSGGAFLAYDVYSGASTRDLVLYLQPPLLGLIGLVAGSAGSWIWQAAPELDFPVAPTSKLSSIQLLEDSVAKPEPPTQWARVFVGAMVMVIGVVLADDFRQHAQKYSAGMLRVQSLGQGEFVTWQLGMFSVLFGGIIAGAGTSAGLRHGMLAGGIGGIGVYAMCAKTGAAFPPIAWWISSVSLQDQPLNSPAVVVTIIGSVMLVGVIAGWMGGVLFPKLAPKGMYTRSRDADG